MDSTTLQVLGVCTAIIIPLLFVAAVIKDKSSRHIILFFCWGTLTGFLAFIGNGIFSGAWSLGMAPEERLPTAIAPIVEEFLKALPLLLLLNQKKHPHIGMSVVYCALASGAGFSVQETIFYFSMSQGTAPDLLVLIIRTLTTALMHGMATGIFGLGLMILQKQRHILLPVIFGLLAVSTSIHALFNLLLPTNAAIIAMLIPVGLYLAGLAVLAGMTGPETGSE